MASAAPAVRTEAEPKHRRSRGKKNGCPAKIILMFEELQDIWCQTDQVLFEGWYGGFHKWGVPPNGWFIVEKPIKMDDFWGTPFQETSLYSIVMYCMFLKLFAGCKYKQSYIVNTAPQRITTGETFLGWIWTIVASSKFHSQDEYPTKKSLPAMPTKWGPHSPHTIAKLDSSSNNYDLWMFMILCNL